MLRYRVFRYSQSKIPILHALRVEQTQSFSFSGDLRISAWGIEVSSVPILTRFLSHNLISVPLEKWKSWEFHRL